MHCIRPCWTIFVRIRFIASGIALADMFIRVLMLLGALAMAYAVHDWATRPARTVAAVNSATQETGALQLVPNCSA